jgi:hypothetical protein
MLSGQVPIQCAQCGGDKVTLDCVTMVLPEAKGGPQTFTMGIDGVIGRALPKEQGITGRHLVIQWQCANGHKFLMLMHGGNGHTVYRESADSLAMEKTSPLPQIFGTMMKVAIENISVDLMPPEVKKEIWDTILNAARKHAPLLVAWMEVGAPIFTYAPDHHSRLLVIEYSKKHTTIAKAMELEKATVETIIRQAMQDPKLALEIKVA